MANENESFAVRSSLIAAQGGIPELKAYHPVSNNNDDAESSFSSGSSNFGQSNHQDSTSIGNNDRPSTSTMSAQQLADHYEARTPQPQNLATTPGNSNKNKQQSSQPPKHSNKQDSLTGNVDEQENGDGNENGGKFSKLKEKTGQAKEALSGAKQKIDDYKNKLQNNKEQREKWKQVLQKAQKDDNWKKYRVPRWSKAVLATSDDLESRAALKDFEKKDHDIKRKAFAARLKVTAHGSTKNAEKTMEDIKAIREEMARKDAPKIRRETLKTLLEKHPVGRAVFTLKCDKFIDFENGLFTKIFDPENSACMKGCSMKMVVLTLFGSGLLSAIFTLIFTV